MKYLYKYIMVFTILLRRLAGGRIYYVHHARHIYGLHIYPSIAAAKAAGAGDRYFDWVLPGLTHEEPA